MYNSFSQKIAVFSILLLCLSNHYVNSYTFGIIGGTGRIGSAISSHLLLRSPNSKIVLVGRDANKGKKSVEEVKSERPDISNESQVRFLQADWRNVHELQNIANEVDCLIHTAGPFLNEKPLPLEAAIESDRCRAYVDVSDPLDFLEISLEMGGKAKSKNTCALLSAGAFPGMSNVLAMEAASQIAEDDGVKDLRFNYFTAGLGGSGDINLYITNIGFGEAMAQFEKGALRFYEELSGSILGKVDFFIPSKDSSDTINKEDQNQKAQERIGTQTVFAWPFPEAATVARHLKISGSSSAAMGTSPDIWNVMLGILVTLVPRKYWRSEQFSKFMADFSKHMVFATDTLLRLSSPDKVGETHAMRVDVTSNKNNKISIVQAHESFRRCVGQSCAEFALDILENRSGDDSGVFLPEQRYNDFHSRKRIVDRLTNTPGTIAYTGAVKMQENAKMAPTNLEEAIQKANESEEALLVS